MKNCDFKLMFFLQLSTHIHNSSVGWIADYRWKINSLIYYERAGVLFYGVSLHTVIIIYLFLIFAVATNLVGNWYQIVLPRISSTWILNHFYQIQYVVYVVLAQEKMLLDGHPRWTSFDSGQEQ